MVVVIDSSVPRRVARFQPVWRKCMTTTIRLVRTMIPIGLYETNTIGYKNCPLPTPEDRLFFILTYLKTYGLQVVQGRLFGMRQSKANQWIHVLLPVLLAALRTLGDAPARS